MHAVIVTVDIDATRVEEAQAALEGIVVPAVKQASGFISGTWMHSADDTRGHGVVLFETEDDAKAAASTAAPPPGSPVTFVSAEVFEIVAQA